HLRLQFGYIERRQYLARLHLVADVHVDAANIARHLCVQLDLLVREELARNRKRVRECGAGYGDNRRGGRCVLCGGGIVALARGGHKTERCRDRNGSLAMHWGITCQDLMESRDIRRGVATSAARLPGFQRKSDGDGRWSRSRWPNGEKERRTRAIVPCRQQTAIRQSCSLYGQYVDAKCVRGRRMVRESRWPAVDEALLQLCARLGPFFLRKQLGGRSPRT